MVMIEIIMVIIRSHFNDSIMYWPLFSNFTSQNEHLTCVAIDVRCIGADIGVTNNCMIPT